MPAQAQKKVLHNSVRHSDSSKITSPHVNKYLQEMPLFKGDMNAWLEKQIQYPDSARKNKQEGRCTLKFIVSEKGVVQNPIVLISSNYALLDSEALRVVRKMPIWKPAKQNGKFVAVYFTLPISFEIGN